MPGQQQEAIGVRVPQLSGFILRKILYQAKVREQTVKSPLSVITLVVVLKNDPGSILDVHGEGSSCAARCWGWRPELHLSSKSRESESCPRRAPSTREESRAGRAQQSLVAFLIAYPAAEALAVLLLFVSPLSSKVQIWTSA